MAKQRGMFKVEGTVDEVTFYKLKDGFLIRQKGGVSADRIAKDLAFARTPLLLPTVISKERQNVYRIDQSLSD